VVIIDDVDVDVDVDLDVDDTAEKRDDESRP